MPRIHPLNLLTCLNVLLNDNGGILSEAEVKRLSGLMRKYSKKLVSKCIYIQILKCTQTDLLGEFMGIDGWNLTHLWLTEGIRTMNWPLVQEILELLLLCPVDVQRLKSNTAPKLVKQLCTGGGNECVRILAERLVQQWLNVVKGETQQLHVVNPTAATTNSISSQQAVLSKTTVHSTNENQTILRNQRQLSTDSTSSGNQGPIKMIILKEGKKIVSKIEKTDDSAPSIGRRDSITEITDQNESKDSTDSSSTKKSDNDNHSEKDNRTNKASDRKSSESKDALSKSKHSSNSKDKSRSSHKSTSSSSNSNKSSKSSTNSSSSKSKSSSHRSSSSSKDKDSEKNRSSDKHRSSSSSSKSSSKSKEKYDKKEKAEKEKAEKAKDQAEKDKQTLTKIQSLNIDKLGKIPKKPKEPSEKPESPQPTSIKIPSKKASMSIEIRKDSEKSKTVKTYKSQFRSHGLTEEAPPPPSRKGLKKPPAIPSGTSIPTTIPTSGLGLPSLKRSSPKQSELSEFKDALPADKKPKIDLTSIPNEKPGSIKLIPPKPKPASLIESDMFMDALSASAPPKKELRKRKRRPSDSKNVSAESPVKSTPLKFYQDTLEENDDQTNEKSKSKSKDADYESPESPPKKLKSDSEDKDENEENENQNNSNGEDEPEIIEKKPPGPGCGPDGPSGVLMLHRRRGPKKKLKWRPQEELEEIRYFELDETERCNVSKTNFSDTAQQERCKEREFLKHRKLGAEDLMTEQTQWAPLKLLDDVPPHPEGSQSKEKKIQMDREQGTLKALYFSKTMIPDSSSEPDFEHISLQEPTVIPLDDVTGNPDAVNDYTKYDWPEPKPMLTESASASSSNDLLLNASPSDLQFPGLPSANNQFNPFLPFVGPQTNLNQNGPQQPLMNVPTNMMAAANNGPMGFNMAPGGMINNMMPSLPFGGNNNFGPQSNNLGNQANNNFGPLPMMNPSNNFAPMVMIPNMNVPRGMMMNRPNGMGNMGSGMNNMGGGMNNMGGWRPGNMPPNSGGGNWRPMNGPSMNNQNNNNNSNSNNNNNNNNSNNNNSNSRNWVHGNQRGTCKQYLRGNCRNGSRCNYYHPPKSRI